MQTTLGCLAPPSVHSSHLSTGLCPGGQWGSQQRLFGTFWGSSLLSKRGFLPTAPLPPLVRFKEDSVSRDHTDFEQHLPNVFTTQIRKMTRGEGHSLSPQDPGCCCTRTQASTTSLPHPICRTQSSQYPSTGGPTPRCHLLCSLQEQLLASLTPGGPFPNKLFREGYKEQEPHLTQA